MLMFAAAAVLALVGVWRSGGPGTGYLVVSFLASATSLAWDLRSRRGAD
jgi:hypothetical protein